jgi:hypothetical protein
MQGYHDLNQPHYEQFQSNLVQQQSPLQQNRTPGEEVNSRNDDVVEIFDCEAHESKGKNPGHSKRGKAFSRDEDLLLCSAWLNVSKDAMIGMVSMYL